MSTRSWLRLARPRLAFDGLSNADRDNIVTCILSMLSQHVVGVRIALCFEDSLPTAHREQEDMSKTEELATKLCTLSYNRHHLLSIQQASAELAANAKREAVRLPAFFVQTCVKIYSSLYQHVHEQNVDSILLITNASTTTSLFPLCVITHILFLFTALPARQLCR
jgi:hypothetical protein